jgi:hypothetical protein
LESGAAALVGFRDGLSVRTLLALKELVVTTSVNGNKYLRL